MKMTEMPNEKIAEPVIDAIYTMTPKLAFAANLLERRLGDRFIARKLESVFAPTLVGIDTKSEDYYSIVADERRRADEAQRSTKAISAMLLKLASDD
jgi:hypothetical protein